MKCPLCKQGELEFDPRGNNLWYARCSRYTSNECSYGSYVEIATRRFIRPVSVRYADPRDTHRVGKGIDPYEGYNEALGEFVRNKQHHKQILKEKGLNES